MREKDLIAKLKKEDDKILIYGAGMVGSLFFSRLLATNIPEEQIAFIVSQKNNDNNFYLGRPVYEVSEAIAQFKNMHVVIATLPGAHKAMIETLHANKIYNFDMIDDNLFAEMEQAYVNKYNEECSVEDGDKEILFLASDNNSTSGAFLCMVELNQDLNERGISTLVVLPGYGTGEALLREKNIKHTYILSQSWLKKNDGSAHPDLSGNEMAMELIRKLIRKYHVKIVHNNTTYTYIGAIAAQKENIPVVWHLREYIKEQGYWFIDEKKAVRLINHSDAVIVVSDYLKSCYGNLLSTAIYKIYDGLDIASCYYEGHRLMDDDRIKILMPGMIIPLKGQMQLLKAAVLLKKYGYNNFEITFVGNAESEYYHKLIKFTHENILENHITFYGRSDEMLKWYCWADIIVVCSKAEAFGRVAVEGQLAGCLVIGSDRGANTEIIEDARTGFLYQYENAEDLALKIIHVIRDKRTACLIAKEGQLRAKELFSKERNANEIIKIYRQILKR